MTDQGTLGSESARAEAERLREELHHHAHSYYVEARPEISDTEYDRLFKRLLELEKNHPELCSPDSPTQRVGAEPQCKFKTVAHTAPMLSLDSTQDVDELRRFDDRIRKALGEGHEPTYVIEPKLDGASIELIYEDGVLTQAVTRGNGRKGEQVTDNIRTISSVPLRLRTEARVAPELLSVRGEVIMYISEFQAFNARLVEAGGEPYASPRNSAAGSVRQLDSHVTASRKLDLLVYDILAIRGSGFKSDTDGIEAIRNWGFKVPDRIQTGRTVEDVLEYHAGFAADREGFDYEIDGIVIKLDDLSARSAIGVTSHHPRWALAFKFEPRQEVTRINKIEVNVGRTGVITPVAVLDPVVVGGVTVSRASLHNREELRRKDLREGDTVRIQRAGDVIPQVVEVIAHEKDRAHPFEMPTECPVCSTPVQEEGPRIKCPNRFGCSAQLQGRIIHLASRSALDIEGLGEETAALLVTEGLVSSLAELFDISPEQLVEYEGFAEKSAASLVEAIQSKKAPDLPQFLIALGIPEVGTAVARDLSGYFGSIEAILGATAEELEQIDGIGPKMSEVITDFLEDERHRSAIDAILARGVEPKASVPVDKDVRSAGTAVFTGALPIPRASAEAAWRAVGGRTASSVSAKTDLVVVGENAGSKREKAERLEVVILDFGEFVAKVVSMGGEVDVP